MVCFNFDGVFADLQQYQRENGNLSISTCHPLFLSILDEFLSLGMEDLLRKRWDDQFADLRAFKEQYDDCLVPPTHPTLGTWAGMQCDHYRLYSRRQPGPLTKERFDLLKSIGFDELANCDEIKAHEINGNRGATASIISPGYCPEKEKGGVRVSFGTLPPPPAAATKESLEAKDRTKKNKSRGKARGKFERRRSSSVPTKLREKIKSHAKVSFKSLSPPPAATRERSRLVRQHGDRELVTKNRRKHNKIRDSVLRSSAPTSSRSVRHSEFARKRNSLSDPPGVLEKIESQSTYSGRFEDRLSKKMEMMRNEAQRKVYNDDEKAIKLLEARVKKKMSSESSKGPAVAPMKTSTHHRNAVTPTKAVDSFGARPKKKTNSKPSEGPAVAPKKPLTLPRSKSFEARLLKKKMSSESSKGPVNAIESFEARLKKKMSSESSKGPVNAIESFEARLKKKMSTGSSKGSAAAPKKPATRPDSAGVPEEGNSGSSQQQKLIAIVQSFEERLAAKTSSISDESLRASRISIMTFEELLAEKAGSDESTPGRRRASVSSDESTTTREFRASSSTSLPGTLKRSLASDELFLEDAMDYIEDEYISWSELGEALTTAAGKSLCENKKTVQQGNRGQR